MAGTRNGTVEDDAVVALVQALGRYGLDVETHPEADAPAIEVAGCRLAVEARSVVTAAEATELAKRWRRRPTPVVVADRIAEAGREALAAAGVNYFDRRGPLRVIAPPLVIDADVPAPGERSAPNPPLSSQVTKEVAIACLLTPDHAHGVREVATFLDRAPSAVSKAMADLRNEGFLTSRNEPLVPDLFHELVSVWRVRRYPLRAEPSTSAKNNPLAGDLGLDDPAGTPGWALTETVAAGALGMPVVARGDYPPDFYVPSQAALDRARSILGDAAPSESRACTVAVAPVRVACLRRAIPPTGARTPWPLTNHIVVALDIAQDKARGLEIVDDWNPTEVTRAW
ncbi:MAG: hypothetical protein ACRDX9_16280 [Acidimicrobiia bacterium]